MRRLTTLLFLTLAIAACKDDGPEESPNAEAPTWTAEIADLDTTGDGSVEVKPPGSEEFSPWRGGQPIPPESVVRTPKSVRATLTLPQRGLLTLNHSTTVKLSEATRIELETGQAVLEYPPDKEADDSEVTVVLPAGHVVLHGTKVALVAGPEDSTVTVTQGLVEVRHAAEAFEARAGQELVLRKGQTPSVSMAPDLGRSVGWSQIGESEVSEGLPEVPRGLGKLVGKTPGGEAEHRLDLVNHKVTVKIQGNLAYTEIHESFKNPLGKTLEGVYRFPMPPDARISRLSLKVGNKWMEGEFLETARAEQIWRDVIEQWRDPAMLKWKEGNTFELRIFPIDPHQTREVKIGYVQRLEPSVGGYTYTYPMPMDRAGLIPAKKFEFEGQLYGHDATQHLELLGYAGTIEKGATEDDRAVAKISFTETDFVARGDLSVRFGRTDARGMRTYAYANPKKKNEDPYAIFVVRPDLPARPEIKPRDFVFVLDHSLSRTGAALDVQRRLVPRMIREMDPLDRAAVVACNERCTEIVPKFELARAALADDVRVKLLELEASGATYPVEAVRVAAELLRRRTDKAREAHVVYLTDGVASVGELRPGKLSDAVQRTLSPFDARMSIVNVGGNSDDLILEALATAGRGRVVELDTMLSLTGQALEVLSAHYREVLERPQLQLPDGLTVDAKLPSAIAAGDEIVLAARYSTDVAGDLVVTGKMNGEDYTLRYPVKLARAAKSTNRFVPGEWAAQRIAALELDAGDHKNEIVKLSKEYGVLSRYTTLLALESREMMDEFGVRKRDRVQWDGDQGAEDAEDAEAEMPPEPMPKASYKPKPKSRWETRAAAPMAADKRIERNNYESKDEAAFQPLGDASKGGGKRSKPKKKKLAMPKARTMPMAMEAESGIVELLDSGSMREIPVRRPTRRRYRRHVPTVRISEARPASSGELNAVRRGKDSLSDDPGNRTKRMRLIRAMIGADQLRAAQAETKDWLRTNPVDPEALVQMAQIDAQFGNLDKFYAGLLSAADAAPRGRWLQERIAHAARTQGDEALACAFDVALEATAKSAPKTPADILACPMTTHVGGWYGEPAPANVLPPKEDEKLRGKVVIKLTSRHGGDYDLMLLEPSGRPLWWGSARQKIKTSNVVGDQRTEVLALPSLRRGTYSVRVIARDGKPGAPLTIDIDAGRTSRKIHVNASSEDVFEVAEFTYR